MKTNAARLVCALTFVIVCGFRIALHYPRTEGAAARGGSSPGGVERPAKTLNPENPLSASGDPSAVWKLAGLEPGATVSADDVFASAGLTRRLRLGLFLTTATAEELKNYLIRCRRENITDGRSTDSVWLRWAELDPRGAVEFDESGSAAWRAWAKVDPAAALAAAKGDPTALREVAAAIARMDPEAGRRLLKDHPDAESGEFQNAMVEGLLLTDPAAAAALALDKNANSEQTMAEWMKRDSAAALAWAENLPDTVNRREMLRPALKQLALTDPALALENAKKLPPGNLRADALADSLGALAKRDPEAARRMAEALPPGADRQQALASLTVSLAESETGKAAALETLRRISWDELNRSWGFEWSAGEEKFRNNASSDTTNPHHLVLRRMMDAAPEETAAVLAETPAEQKPPLRDATGIWLKNDPEGASRWAAALPRGPVKDQAVQAITNWLVDHVDFGFLTGSAAPPDLEAAVAWTEEFSQEDDRNKSLLKIFTRWRREDPNGAAAALERLNPEPELRASIETIFQKRP